MDEEQMLKIQKINDKLFVLLFLYNKNIKINRPTTDNDVAVYGIIFKSVSFIIYSIYIKFFKLLRKLKSYLFLHFILIRKNKQLIFPLLIVF